MDRVRKESDELLEQTTNKVDAKKYGSYDELKVAAEATKHLYDIDNYTSIKWTGRVTAFAAILTVIVSLYNSSSVLEGNYQDDLKRLKDVYRRDIHDQKKEKEKLKNDIKGLENKIIDIEDYIKTLEGNSKGLEEKLDKNRDLLNALEPKVMLLRDEEKELSKIANQHKDKSELVERISKLDDEIIELKDIVREQLDSISQKNVIINDLEVKNLQLSTSLQEQESKLIEAKKAETLLEKITTQFHFVSYSGPYKLKPGDEPVKISDYYFSITNTGNKQRNIDLKINHDSFPPIRYTNLKKDTYTVIRYQDSLILVHVIDAKFKYEPSGEQGKFEVILFNQKFFYTH